MGDKNAALAKKATEVKSSTKKKLKRPPGCIRQQNKGKKRKKEVPSYENFLTVQSGDGQSYPAMRKIDDVAHPNLHCDRKDTSDSPAFFLAAAEGSLAHAKDDDKQMHVDSLNVQVSVHQSLKDGLPVIEHAGSSGKGCPYAPEDWPSPGDVWTWRVGKRYTRAGFWQDRSLHPPDCLQSSTGNKMIFYSRDSLEKYILNTFPDADVDAFFASFIWKIPCTNAAKDASLKMMKSKGCSKSAPIVRPGDCKASNEMCRIKAKTRSTLSPATCNTCCSEPNFCRNCCCILCSKAIDWIYDGYSFIRCDALVDEKFICGHVAHIKCALRAYLAGKVGGSIDLDAQYYCRCCDNKTDLLLHVDKIIKVSESIDNRDDMVKVLNLGFSMLCGSEKVKANKLRNRIAILTEKLKHGVSPDKSRKKKGEIVQPEQGIMGIEDGNNEVQNFSAPQSSKKRRRGPTNGKRYNTQEPKYIEWSDNGKPIGKWAKSFKAYVGDIARSKIDINIKNWKAVNQGLKDTIWKDVKTEYHIEEKMKNIVLRNYWERWKGFKAKLVSGWITKTRKLPEDHKEPYEFYDGITQEQWKTFKKNCETEEFKQISEKARKSQSYNEHPHYLGQAGYAGKKAKWIAEGHNSSITLPSGPTLDRSIDWVLARSKKGADGKYAIPNEKTKMVADKVNDWREKVIEGTWIPNRHDDVLNRALGKKELSGRVRGIGGTVGIKDIFGKVQKRKSSSGVISTDELHLISQEIEAEVTKRVRQETLVKVESMMDTMVERKVANILNRMGMQMPIDIEIDNTPLVDHCSSGQSTYLGKLPSANKTQEADSYAELQTTPNVSKDKVEMCVAKGPTSQPNKVLVESNNEKVMNTMTNKSAKRNTIVDEEILRTLTDDCRYFHDLIVQVPSDDIVINAIQVNKDLLTYDEDFEIHITIDDIIQFLNMACLNASWLQIYIMWLNQMCTDLEVKTIGFMCPHKLSQARKNPEATNTYILNTWRTLQSKSLLLAPYYEGKNCLLLVFHLEKNEVYVFDPQAECKRKLEIKPQVNIAFKTYKAYGGKFQGTTLKWKTVKCSQQSGSKDCVYNVMRYMHEIVKNHHQNIDLHKDFVQDDSYSQQKMDEVRDNLANYIMYNWM